MLVSVPRVGEGSREKGSGQGLCMAWASAGAGTCAGGSASAKREEGRKGGREKRWKR